MKICTKLIVSNSVSSNYRLINNIVPQQQQYYISNYITTIYIHNNFIYKIISIKNNIININLFIKIVEKNCRSVWLIYYKSSNYLFKLYFFVMQRWFDQLESLKFHSFLRSLNIFRLLRNLQFFNGSVLLC